MTSQLREVPLGIQVFRKATDKCCGRAQINRTLWYRGSVLTLTYLAYMCYHLSRKPISVVKNVLNQNCSSILVPDGEFVNDSNRATWCDWAPFDGTDAPALLGTLDSAFLFAYALAMFGSGFVAERVNLRYFLALGMIASGIASYLFGIAKSYDIHNLWYFIFVQIFGGVAQTTGWPGVVTVVGNWFGKGKRGLIFGIWNSHTSIGNILGSLIAGEYVETDWSLSFIVPGIIIAFCGLGIFLFLVAHPADVGCTMPDHKHHKYEDNGGYHKIDSNLRADSGSDDHSSETDDTDIIIGDDEGIGGRRRIQAEDAPILMTHLEPSKAVGFIEACKIPGVLEFSFSLFFAKLVSYTFLYWLPLYIKSSTTLNATLSADLSTLFDVGGIVGAIAAGVISDYSGMSATTCAVMLTLTAPMLFVYDVFGSTSLPINIILLLVVGLLVNGPYALITTSVSAELGTHHSLEGNSKALATVTAIIDGTGSIGAAVGPLLAGLVSSKGWYNVFYMLIAADLLALLLLSRMVFHEIQQFLASRRLNRLQ